MDSPQRVDEDNTSVGNVKVRNKRKQLLLKNMKIAQDIKLKQHQARLEIEQDIQKVSLVI